MIAWIQRLFVRVVASIEDDDTPLSRYFHLFGAILAVRLMLEFYSNNRRWELDDVIHISLWFTFIVLAFLLQLKLFSGEQIARVAKLVVVCFTIALTAPLIDLLIFGGKGIKMNYLAVNSWKELLWSYLTIGGSSLSRGATPGIRVEIFLLVLASFNYIRTKSGSILRAILGTWCIYTVLFFSGTIPILLNKFMTTAGLEYVPGSPSAILLLLFLDLVMLGAGILMHAQPTNRRNILQSVDPLAILLGLAALFFGVFQGLSIHPDRFSWNSTTIFYPLLGIFAGVVMAIIHAFGRFDAAAGVVNRQGKDAALLLLMIPAFALGGKLWFLVMVWWGCGFLLNEKPLQLRRVIGLGHVLKGVQFWSIALMGWTLVGGILIGYPVLCLGMQVSGTGLILLGYGIGAGDTWEELRMQEVLGRGWKKAIAGIVGAIGLTLVVWASLLMG